MFLCTPINMSMLNVVATEMRTKKDTHFSPEHARDVLKMDLLKRGRESLLKFETNTCLPMAERISLNLCISHAVISVREDSVHLLCIYRMSLAGAYENLLCSLQSAHTLLCVPCV